MDARHGPAMPPRPRAYPPGLFTPGPRPPARAPARHACPPPPAPLPAAHQVEVGAGATRQQLPRVVEEVEAKVPEGAGHGGAPHQRVLLPQVPPGMVVVVVVVWWWWWWWCGVVVVVVVVWCGGGGGGVVWWWWVRGGGARNRISTQQQGMSPSERNGSYGCGLGSRACRRAACRAALMRRWPPRLAAQPAPLPACQLTRGGGPA
jgi:hypothetical protein